MKGPPGAGVVAPVPGAVHPSVGRNEPPWALGLIESGAPRIGFPCPGRGLQAPP